MAPLTEFILKLVEVFDRLQIPYALGGALATSYWGTTRATEDADCLVNVPAITYQQFADELNAIGCVMDVPSEGSSVSVAALRAQVEQRKYMAVEWNDIRAELFVPIVPLQNEMLRRAVLKPLENRQIRVTTAEDLILLKMSFHRQKDIMDVRSILYVQRDKLDLEYLRHHAANVLNDATSLELESLIQTFTIDDENGNHQA